MLLWMILKVALRSLAANKLRSILAMLGVIIGVGAVIAMLAIGAGARQQILSRLTALGTNLLTIRPGQRGFMGVMSGTQQNLTVDDALAIVREVEGVKQVAPAVGSSVQVKYMSRNTRTMVTGTTVTYLPMRSFEIDAGEAFTEAMVDGSARVAVLGPQTATDLFGVEDPVGKTIKIRGINFRVLGVLKPKGDQGWFNPDDQVIIPLTTAMKQLFGVDYVREINVQVNEDADISRVQNDILALLRRRHRIQEGMPDDVNIRNQAEMLAAFTESSRTFTVLLGSIAGISLLVGGIGIMNIMLVSVTERTREIGIRKAIGARDRDILRQFLIEALIMSGVGGLLGVALGVGGARVIGSLSNQFPTLVQVESVALALAFSAAVGVFFGYYPAWRAARLDPIEALRYE